MLLAKTTKSRLVLPVGWLGIAYTVHLWLAGKCVVEFLLVLIKYVSVALTVEVL